MEMLTKQDITEPLLLIRIPKLFKPGMTEEALYEATRGVWKVNPDRAKNAQYALCIAKNSVQEVYVIEQPWNPADPSNYKTRNDLTTIKYAGRWEFIGKVAPVEIRSKYVGKSTTNMFKKGEANPISYVNI